MLEVRHTRWGLQTVPHSHQEVVLYALKICEAYGKVQMEQMRQIAHYFHIPVERLNDASFLQCPLLRIEEGVIKRNSALIPAPVTYLSEFEQRLLRWLNQWGQKPFKCADTYPQLLPHLSKRTLQISIRKTPLLMQDTHKRYRRSCHKFSTRTSLREARRGRLSLVLPFQHELCRNKNELLRRAERLLAQPKALLNISLVHISRNQPRTTVFLFLPKQEAEQIRRIACAYNAPLGRLLLSME